MTDPRGIVRVIRAIAAGAPVDWSAADPVGLDGSLQDIVRELQVVARIAEVHGAGGDPPAGDHAGGAESAPRDTAWGPLTVMEHVGSGSFGDVYRAWDPRLDREVALKILRRDAPDARGSATAVVEEGRLLARVRHPNVVTVFGADRVNGDVGIWMEFVEGRTLEQLVHERGPFDATAAATIGVEICRALAAVHRAGLLHRDVKAHNVMREDSGRVVLMDFGAGCDLNYRAHDGGLAGTALYLAPEILAGGAATSASDVYSVGVTLYHLVTGAYPVQGRTLAEIRDVHASRAALSLRRACPSLPAAFTAAVDRALIHEPDRRIESTGLESALAAVSTVAQGTTTSQTRGRRRAAIAVVAVLALAAAAMERPDLRRSMTGVLTTSSPRIDSLAVLPFENQYGDDFAFLADGIADDIAVQLAHLPHVRVLTRASSARVLERDALTVGERLRVQALLSGSIRRSPGGLIVTVQLIDARSGRMLARHGYTGALDDIGGARGPASEIARALQQRLWPGQELRLVPERPQSAYLAYLRGRSALGPRTEASLREAVTRFEQAVAAEPTFADSYAGLADAHLLNGVFGFAPKRDAWPKAKGAAVEALRLDDRLAEAHTSLAFGMELWEHRWVDAEDGFKRAITINPSYALAHHWYALLLDSTLRGDAAMKEIETARSLEPFSASINTDVGMILLHQRRYDDAVRELSRAAALYPTYADVHKELGWAYGFSGRLDEGLASLNRARELGSSDVDVLMAIGCMYAYAGRTDEARATIRQLEARAARHPGGGIDWTSEILLFLGEKDKALDQLLVSQTDGNVNILIGQSWDGVRDDPRYRELVRRAGLQNYERR